MDNHKAIKGTSALVLGASSAIGQQTVKALVRHGAHVTATSRDAARLRQLRADTSDQIQTRQADAADPTAIEAALREASPTLVVLATGTRLRAGSLLDQTWETFSQTWHTDTRAAFHLVQAALTLPLPPASKVVIVSSGAAVNGSPLSGGYAGAKRMQWLLAGYAQHISDQRRLGIRFATVLPLQLVEGTAIAESGADTYAQTMGITAAEFMKRYEQPLYPSGVAAAIMRYLEGDVPGDASTIRVSGGGIEVA